MYFIIQIETTGMADPSPVLQTFYASDTVGQFCDIDGVITVVDCKNLLQHLQNDAKSHGAVVNESVQQVIYWLLFNSDLEYVSYADAKSGVFCLCLMIHGKLWFILLTFGFCLKSCKIDLCACRLRSLIE